MLRKDFLNMSRWLKFKYAFWRKEKKNWKKEKEKKHLKKRKKKTLFCWEKTS